MRVSSKGRVAGDAALVAEVRQTKCDLKQWAQRREAGESVEIQYEVGRERVYQAERALRMYRTDVWERDLRARRQYERA